MGPVLTAAAALFIASGLLSSYIATTGWWPQLALYLTRSWPTKTPSQI